MRKINPMDISTLMTTAIHRLQKLPKAGAWLGKMIFAHHPKISTFGRGMARAIVSRMVGRGIQS